VADQLWLVTRILEEEEVHQTNEPQDHEVFTVSWPLTLVFLWHISCARFQKNPLQYIYYKIVHGVQIKKKKIVKRK